MSIKKAIYEYDAIVVGSGPNGLAAAITLSRCGHRVVVYESASEVGGGCRTAELTLPGFRHDVCSSVYPLIPLSPFFRQLSDEGVHLDLVKPEIALAHVMDHGRAVAIYEDLQETVAGLNMDGDAYARLVEPFLKSPARLFKNILAPPLKLRNPLPVLRFGWRGIRSAESLAMKWFDDAATQGMFAGMAAHSMLPLDRCLTGAVGLMFCIAAHSNGWPFARGGAESVSKVLAEYFVSLGGQIETSTHVTQLSQLPASRAVLFDTTPAQMLKIAGTALPESYHRSVRAFRHGPGICKIDWALDGAIPWTAHECRRAGTVHVGGTLQCIMQGEQSVWNRQMPQDPFVLVTQPSLFDSGRAPSGKHVAWAYCHVPHGYATDMSDLIERKIDKAAPGFRDTILGRHVMTTSDLESYNANYIGGDISGGAMNLWQFIARPVLRIDPYSTPNPRLFICSASTPPGPGVHGMCGHNAAQSVLSHALSKKV